MHISYRYSEPEYIIRSDNESEVAIFHEALHELRKVKMAALAEVQKAFPANAFTANDFGIHIIDHMIAVLDEEH